MIFTNFSTQQNFGKNIFTVAQTQKSITMEIPSCLCEVGRAGLEVTDFLISQKIKDSSSVEIVFRELLANAISHGNQNDAGMLVRAQIVNIDNRFIKLVVEDLGGGFNYREMAAKAQIDQQIRARRGYQLIWALAHKVRFSAKGNHVTAYVAIHQESSTGGMG